MAAIVQQSQPQEVSAARAFWNGKMQEHPNIAGGLALAGEVAGFFLNGHALIRFGQWVVRVTGSIAETALLFAVIWITLASVAPGLLELFLSKTLIQFFLWIALASLAIIPEIILPNSLINCAKHWFTAARERHPLFWMVAVLFTLPTLAFLVLTGITIQTLNANGGNLIQTGANLLNIRCFAGWGYGLLEIVYLGVKNSFPREFHIAPAQPVAPSVPTQPIDHEEIARQLLPLVAQEVKNALQSSTQTAPIGVPENTLSSEVMSEESASESDTPIAPVDAPETLTEEPQEERNNITLMSDRKSASRSAQTRSEKARKAASIIRRNPQISASDLAKKAQISTSYARKLLVNQ